MPITQTIICRTCGKAFIAQYKPSHQPPVYCSHNCWHSDALIESRTCALCGKVFTAKITKWHSPKYCSVECAKAKRVPHKGQERICVVCGTKFYRPPSQPGQYCSRKCACQAMKDRKPYVMRQCLQCGKEFKVAAKVARQRDNTNFCSRTCRAKYYPHRHPIGTELSLHFETPCLTCGKPMRVTEAQLASGKQFCSNKCVNKGREHPERRVARITVICESCGKPFETYPTWVPRTKYCSRSCAGYGSILKQNWSTEPTTIEKLLANELEARGITFSAQYHLPPWIIDIAFPTSRIGIEADGDYWHSLEAAQKRDVRKDADLAARGWLVLRFWEREIRESPAKCIDRVLACIAERAKSV